MNEEKDFFKTCFNTVAGLEVKNESQAIAKEIVLSEIENLQQENQELKNIINQIGFEPDEIAFLQQENQELKKQVEEYKEQVNKGLYNTCLPYTTGYNKAIKDKETQQKEFIKYLEDESKEVYRDGGLRQNIFRQILQKYKEIIGVSDEKK